MVRAHDRAWNDDGYGCKGEESDDCGSDSKHRFCSPYCSANRFS
jgi:hypothetical protein